MHFITSLVELQKVKLNHNHTLREQIKITYVL